MGQSAGQDMGEGGEIQVHVERKSISRDTTIDPDSDRGNFRIGLVRMDPNAGFLVEAVAVNSPMCEGPDQDLFQHPHILLRP